MKSSTKKLVRILLLACVVLGAALILLQLVPYWTYENSETSTTDTISILEYTVLPSAHPDVTKLLNTNTNEAINSVAGTFCIVFMLGIASIVFIIVKSSSLWVSLFPAAVGIGSLIGYLTDPVWQLGSIFIPLIIVSALLALCGLIAAAIWVHSFKYWFMDPKDWPSAKK